MAQIPEEVTRCVAFLGYRKKVVGGDTEIVLCGTTFLTSRTISPQNNIAATYLVTARHVIEGIASRAVDDKTLVRFNGADGLARWVELARSEWVFSEDESVDVAIAPFASSGIVLAHSYVQETLFATTATFFKHKIGAGDEVFFPGLLKQHSGDTANVPIVRTGSIAALPSEPVKAGWGPRAIRAHLIEARSIGGLSGSPVFVQIGPIIKTVKGRGGFGSISYFLIGLIHGHFDSRTADMAEDASDFDVGKTNSGIAIVVPSTDIVATLNQNSFVAQRNALLGRSKAKGGLLPK